MQVRLSYRLSFLLATAGIGLWSYGGLQWYELPQYSEDDLKASTELNFQLDLTKQSIQIPSAPEQLEKLRGQVRGEIEDGIHSDHQRVLNWLATGLAHLVLAGGQSLVVKLAH